MMNDEDRKVLALHSRRSMARLIYKMEEAQRFGSVHWFGQWEPDLEQVRAIEDRLRATKDGEG
jgi:hypothetical protein